MLNNFDFCSYTHFVFGRDSERKAGEMIAKDGGHTVLIIHGPGKHVNANGMLDNVKSDIEANGMKWVEYSDVKPNPDVKNVREAIELCRKSGVDYVLSIGGGSVIDSGKAVCAGLAYDGDVWDLFSTMNKCDPSRKPNHAVILTSPASGSESGFGTMMGNEKTKQKKGMRGGGNFMRVNICFMNPELTMSLPIKQTLCGVVDMYSHIVERYFSNVSTYGIIDYMSEGAMKAIKHFGYVLLNDPSNYEARAEIMYAGSVAHNDTLGVGRGKDMGSHDIGHEISAMYDTVHGITISVVMPSWMRHVYKTDVNRFARYAEEVFGIPHSDDAEKTALAGIDATEKWFKDMLMPTNFKDAGVPTDSIELLAKKASMQRGGHPLGGFQPLYYDDILAILKAAAQID